MFEEVWKDVKGFEGLYKISNTGKVFSYFKEKHYGNGLMKPSNDGHGYFEISLKKNNKRKHFKVHFLVANHFLKKSNNKTQVNHIDFNTKNNYVDNLEWVTSSENIQHLLKNKGISNQFTKFSKVAQYDMDGNLLNVFGSPLDAIKFLDIKNKNGKYDSRGINYCCRNKQKSYKNFMWKYFKNKPLKKINKYKSKKSSLSRKIKSIDKNGNIRIFNSITDASIFLNIRRSDISSVLIGRQKTAKGVSFYYLKNN